MATSDCTTPKRCTKCGEEYPLTREHWPLSKRGKCGFDSRCKSCKRAYEALPKRVETRRQYALSPHGKEVKQRGDAAYRDTKRVEIAARKRAYSAANSTTIVARVTAWKRGNPDKVADNRRRYHVKHREQVNAKGRRWRQRFPEKERAKAQRRRARERNAPGSHTAADIRLQLKSQRGLCWWCGETLSSGYHVDHRIPLNRGGTNDAGNLCITCVRCNLAKGAKLAYEWNGRLL